MECDRSRSGDVIHCVGCSAELRIPFSSAKTGLISIERAELIIPGAVPAAPLPSQLPPGVAAATNVPPPENPISSHASQSLEATCPVCQAHLRFDPQKPSNHAHENPPPIAELVHHKQLTTPTTVPTAAPQGSPPASINHQKHLSFEERERQIAEGRKAHPIQTNPSQKPRLDYILSGGANPPGKAPPKNQPRSDHEKSTGRCHHDSFSE
jgi:hypothetical protein